ncbi:MAG: hypothetical protein QM598_02065 [Protaetiibacter sp.]
MPRRAVRITTVLAKTTFVLAWLIVGLALNVLLGALGLSGLPQNLIALGFTVVAMVIGVRSFRGAGEPLRPPRAWWRATATSASSFVLGGLWLVAGIACWWGMASGLLAAGSPFVNGYVVAFYLVAGGYYLHSGWRIRDDAGAPKTDRMRAG